MTPSQQTAADILALPESVLGVYTTPEIAAKLLILARNNVSDETVQNFMTVV